MFGLYGNTLDEAYYPSAVADGDGAPLDAGKHDYVLRFTKEQIPAVKAFWSVTLYKLPEKLLAENPLRRYAIGDRTEGLTYGDDGSLSIYIQHQSPGKARESNWLPAPAGPFYLVLRMYLPTPEAMAGPYVPPPIVKSR